MEESRVCPDCGGELRVELDNSMDCGYFECVVCGSIPMKLVAMDFEVTIYDLREEFDRKYRGK